MTLNISARITDSLEAKSPRLISNRGLRIRAHVGVGACGRIGVHRRTCEAARAAGALIHWLDEIPDANHWTLRKNEPRSLLTARPLSSLRTVRARMRAMIRSHAIRF